MIDHLSSELEARLRQALSTKIDQLLDAPIAETTNPGNSRVVEISLIDEDQRSMSGPTVLPGAIAPRHGRATHPARLAIAATLLAAAAATAGVAVISGRDQPESIGSVAPTVSPNPVLVDSTSPASTPTTTALSTPLATIPPEPVDKFSGTSGWYLPSYVPDGYDLTSLTAYPANQTSSPRSSWVRLDPITGEIVSMLSVRVVEAPAPDSGVDTQGMMKGPPGDVYDSGQGMVAAWIEGDVLVQLRSLGMDEDQTAQAAESLIIDATTNTATLDVVQLPDFELVVPVALPEEGHVHLGLNYQSATGSTSDFISASISPNFAGESVDTSETRFFMADQNIEVVDGTELLVQRRPADGFGPFTTVTWFDGPTRFDVSGRAPADEVVAFARSLTAASFDETQVLGKGISQRALNLDTIASAAFDDGVRVSIRGRDGNPYVICIEHPVVRCSYEISEGFLVGDQQTALAEVFQIDGRQVLITWLASLGVPELAANGMTNDPSTPPAMFTSATIKQIVGSDTGQFVEVDVPSGELPPTVRLYDEFGGYTEIGVEPLTPGILRF